MARTDNDTWDLASSVGATATMVATQRALATREGLIDDPFAEPLVRAVGVDFFTRFLDGEIEFEDLDPAFNLRLAAEGMAVRTRFFDKLFTDAAAVGARQAVILAAGLDSRAYRLPWPDGTVVFEVDQRHGDVERRHQGVVEPDLAVGTVGVTCDHGRRPADVVGVVVEAVRDPHFAV